MNSDPDTNSPPPHSNPSGTGETTSSVSKPPRVWTSILSPFVALFLAVVLQACFGVVLAITMMGPDQNPAGLENGIIDILSDPPIFILILVLGQLAFAITAFAGGYLSPEPLIKRLAFPPDYASPKIYLLTCLGSIFVLAVSLAAAYGASLVANPDESLAALFDKMTIGWSIPFVILIALLPGFIEEILFRGYLQTRLLKRWSPTIAIGVSSILFAIAHIALPAIALALILGVWFGYIAYRTGSIGPGIACHAFVNGGLNLWRMIIKFGEIPETTQHIFNGSFVAVGLVCFILSIRELIRLPVPESALRATTTNLYSSETP